MSAACFIRVSHNTVQRASGKLELDIELIALEVYFLFIYFSNSTVKTENLKDFCALLILNTKCLYFTVKRVSIHFI